MMEYQQNNKPQSAIDFHYDKPQNDIYAYTQYAHKSSDKSLNKTPKHNKLRIVYQADQQGNVLSYIHVSHDEAERIIKIIKYLVQKRDWVTIDKIYNDLKADLKCSKRTIQYWATKMFGVQWIDMRDGQYYKRLANSPIVVKQDMYNKKRNLPGYPQFMKAPFYIRAAGIN